MDLVEFENLLTAEEIKKAKGHNVNFGAPIETMIKLGGGNKRSSLGK